MRKISPTGKLYHQRLHELVEAYLIVYPCNRCGSPVNQGYVCIFCDNNDPREPEE